MLVILLLVFGAGAVGVVETYLAARQKPLLVKEDNRSAKAWTDFQNAFWFIDFCKERRQRFILRLASGVAFPLPEQPGSFIGLERQAGGNKTNRSYHFFGKGRRKK